MMERLPFDWTRCVGTEAHICQDCMRSADLGNEIRQSYFVMPPIAGGTCESYIKGQLMHMRGGKNQ